MKQTAVDWLEKNIWEHIEYKPILEIQIIRKKIEQAKEMEKHQILNTYIEASPKRGDILKEASERYYNETFNTNEK